MRRRGLRVSVRRGPPAYGSGHSTEGKPTPPAPRSGPRPGRRPALREARAPGPGAGQDGVRCVTRGCPAMTGGPAPGVGCGASQGGGASAHWMYADVPTTRRGAVAVVARPPGRAGRSRGAGIPARRDGRGVPGGAGRAGAVPGLAGVLPEELRPPTGARGGRWARQGSSGRAHPPGLRRLGEGAAGRRRPGGASAARPAGRPFVPGGAGCGTGCGASHAAGQGRAAGRGRPGRGGEGARRRGLRPAPTGGDGAA